MPYLSEQASSAVRPFLTWFNTELNDSLNSTEIDLGIILLTRESQRSWNRDRNWFRWECHKFSALEMKRPKVKTTNRRLYKGEVKLLSWLKKCLFLETHKRTKEDWNMKLYYFIFGKIHIGPISYGAIYRVWHVKIQNHVVRLESIFFDSIGSNEYDGTLKIANFGYM